MPPPMLSPGAFAPPPLSPQGEASPEPLFTAVGRALSAWEKVEHQIADLYAVLLGTAIPIGATRAYGAIATFTARQAMVSAASTALFHYRPNAALRDRVRVLVNNVCKSASARRNEIAHGIVMHLYDGRNDRSGYFLCASMYSSVKRGMNSEAKYEFSAYQIEAYAALFATLAMNVYAVTDEVSEWQSASKVATRRASRETPPCTPSRLGPDDSRTDPPRGGRWPQSSDPSPAPE